MAGYVRYILKELMPCSNIFGSSAMISSFQSSIVIWKL